MTVQFWIILALSLFSPPVISFPNLDNEDATASIPWMAQTKDSKSAPLAEIPSSNSRLNGSSTPRKAILQTTELPSESLQQSEFLRPPKKPASSGTVTPTRKSWLQRYSHENEPEETLLQKYDELASSGETSPTRIGSSRKTDLLSKSTSRSVTGLQKQRDVDSSDTFEQTMSLTRETDQVSKAAGVQKKGPLRKRRRSSRFDSSSTFKAACDYEKVINNDPDQNIQCTRDCISISTAIEEAYENHPFHKAIEALFDDCAGFTKGSCAKMARAGRKKYPVCNCLGWTDPENFKTEYAYKCRARFMKLKTARNSEGVINDGKKEAVTLSKEVV